MPQLEYKKDKERENLDDFVKSGQDIASDIMDGKQKPILFSIVIGLTIILIIAFIYDSRIKSHIKTSLSVSKVLKAWQKPVAGSTPATPGAVVGNFKSIGEKNKVLNNSLTDAKEKLGENFYILAPIEATLFANQKKYAEAISKFASTEAKVKKNAVLYGQATISKGLLLEEQKKLDEALAEFNKASVLESKFIKESAQYHLARVNLVKGNKDAALKHFKTLKSLNPGSSYLYHAEKRMAAAGLEFPEEEKKTQAKASN